MNARLSHLAVDRSTVEMAFSVRLNFGQAVANDAES